MTDMELGYRMAKIGFKVFKSCYNVLDEFVISDRERAVSEIVNKARISETSAKIVAGHAKVIFESGREREALEFAKKGIG